MRLDGELHDGLSERQRAYGINCKRNLEGWFDRIWEAVDFRGSQKDALLHGEAVVAQNEEAVARYQLTAWGDLVVVLCRKGYTKAFTINRLTGEKVVDFYVRTQQLISRQ